jgi:hypothetical protein
MIGNLTYDQVESIAKELEESIATITAITKNLNVEEMQDFLSTVEGYSKYLKTTVEMSKDADKALEELKSKK